MVTRIGQHKVKLGNVMDGIDDLMEGEKADLVYSDPPWGQGNLKYWETMRQKMDRLEEPRIDPELDDFLNQIFKIAYTYTNNYVLIEYGQKWEKEIIGKAGQYGFKHNGKVVTYYASPPRPLDLHVFSKAGGRLPHGFEDKVGGTKGYDTVQKAISFFALKDGLILDPCCGMGFTAQAALDHGMRFRGNEMNKTRLQKTIDRLS